MSIISKRIERFVLEHEIFERGKVNYIDQSWKWRSISARIYLGTATQSWSFYVITPRWQISIDTGRKLYQEQYIGPEDPYMGEDPRYWEWRRESYRPKRASKNYASGNAWHFRIKQLWVFVRFWDIIKLSYYNRKISLHLRWNLRKSD